MDTKTTEDKKNVKIYQGDRMSTSKRRKMNKKRVRKHRENIIEYLRDMELVNLIMRLDALDVDSV